MKIGIVDLDSSHPAVWIPLERDFGHEIAGVWDGGSVHPRAYVEAFAAEHRIPRIYESLEVMAREVDVAIIHGCDWDTHMAKSRPFVDAGRAVLIDKPLAGKAGDLRQLAEWIRQGARITGGSALRFCGELRSWLLRPASERGIPQTAFCGCAVDEFNYGIHAYSLLAGILGAGILSVRHLGLGGQRRIQVKWADGRMGFLAIGRQEAWLPFHASVVTERAAVQFIPDHRQLYRALLEATLPYLARLSNQPPVPWDELIEPELAAIAAQESWQNGDREIFLQELLPSSGYDGAGFAASYRSSKYKSA
jgi:hypothetical protein